MLRSLIYFYTIRDKDVKLTDPIVKIISTEGLTDNIKSGKFQSDTYYDLNLSEEQFIDILSGKNMKNLVFSAKNINSNRNKIEEFYKVILDYH